MQQQRNRYLQQQNRLRYLSYQQRYWDRIRADQYRLQNSVFYDNLYNNYSYYRDNQYYYTSQYGAQMLRNALNNGYEAGLQAGQADRYDNWGYNYQDSYGYEDATYGYDNYYVSMDEYSYYFRQGFERGYEDGYYGRYQYGTYNNGKYSLLGNIIGTILDIVAN